ncbi:hypothetical protein ACLB2K_038091 [Fragaria x ananassa]
MLEPAPRPFSNQSRTYNRSSGCKPDHTPTSTLPAGQSSARGSSSGTHGSSAARGGSQQGSGQRGRPMTRAKLHAMTQQEGRISPDVIIGMLLSFGQPAFTLIDHGATHSFMSSRFALHANVSSSSLPGE